MSPVSFTILLLTCLLPGQQEHAASFQAGKDTAADRNAPLLVFVHGSDWNLLGQRLMETVWQSEDTWSLLEKTSLVYTDVDILQSAPEADRERNNQRNTGWKGAGLVTYPAFIAYGPDGTLLGSRQGETLPRDAAGARAALLELVEASRARILLEKQAAVAKEAGDGAAEIRTLHQMLDLPLQRPPNIVERLGVLDPEDTSGMQARLTMPPWHQLVSAATTEARQGQAPSARDRLQVMLAEDGYTDTQRAWIHVALGSVHRQWEGHDTEAGEAFKAAWTIDPESIAGRAGMRMYLRHYGTPSLLMGWGPRHCTVTDSWWRLEDLDDPLEAGTYHLTLTRTRGKQGLEIASVQVLDAGGIVAEDTHPGLAGKEHRENVYVLEIPQRIPTPILRIQCRTGGGTNSTGTLVLEGPLD